LSQFLRNKTQNFSFFAHQFCAKKQQFAQSFAKVISRKIALFRVVFRIVLKMSEQSLEFNGMPEVSTSRAVAVDTSRLHITAPGPVLYTAHRQHTEGIFPDELTVGEEEQGSCYCAEPRIY